MKKSQMVYLVGVMLFGFGYYAIKSRLDNDLVLVVCAAVYFVLLSIIAKRFK